ncbi:MAG: hypothetical protein H6936_07295 [Burkholderiales bacterium]|nr:hypothetical protein [Nitrosomonas sp.]MCP5274647.1 hypothetical protein [Burkholderiales bacterium]
MKKVIMTFLQSVFRGCIVFLLGVGFGSNAYAIDLNDFTLDVQVITHGNDTQGVIPVFALVTYAGAGVDTLTAGNFSTQASAQMLPSLSTECSVLTLDAASFSNKGDGVYHLGLKPQTGFCGGTYYLSIKVDMRPGFGVKASGMAVLEIFRFSFNLN